MHQNSEDNGTKNEDTNLTLSPMVGFILLPTKTFCFHAAGFTLLKSNTPNNLNHNFSTTGQWRSKWSALSHPRNMHQLGERRGITRPWATILLEIIRHFLNKEEVWKTETNLSTL